MMCQSCWAYEYDFIHPVRCKIDRFDKNRPDGISPERLRHQVFVEDRNLLKTWKCEFRYTKEEVEKIKAGKFKEVHVSWDHAKKILEKVQEIIKRKKFVRHMSAGCGQAPFSSCIMSGI